MESRRKPEEKWIPRKAGRSTGKRLCKSGERNDAGTDTSGFTGRGEKEHTGPTENDPARTKEKQTS